MLRQAQHEVFFLTLSLSKGLRVHREPSAYSALSLFAASMLLPLAACSDFSADRALQKQPSFKEGYEDGCAAANAQGADLRDRTVGDKQLYANDEMYRKGWSAGFQTCRRSDIEPNAQPGDSPIRLPGPGH